MPLRAHLKLLLCVALPCVDEWREVIFQLRIGSQDWKYFLIRTTQELDGMGKSAILAILKALQIPNDSREQYDWRLNKEVALLL